MSHNLPTLTHHQTAALSLLDSKFISGQTLGEALERKYNYKPTQPAFHVLLKRLEAYGLIASKYKITTTRTKYYKRTREGAKQLRQTINHYKALQ